MPVNKNNLVVGLQADNTLKVGAYGAAEVDAVEVGGLEGGVSIDHSEEQVDLEVDQIVGIVGSVTTKEEMTVKVSLAEPTLAMLAIAFGYPVAAVSGSTFSFGAKTSNTERTLFINVKGPGASTATRKYIFWRAIPTGKSGHSYKKGDKTLVEVEFKILVDTTKTAEQRFGTVVDTGADTTPPTIAMTTPTSGGTRTAGGKTTVLLTITEANPMDENSIVYGDADNATVSIIKEGGGAGASALVAGAIAYSASAKTIEFTPSANWEPGNYTVQVTTGLRDQANNHLAAQFLGYFTVSA